MKMVFTFMNIKFFTEFLKKNITLLTVCFAYFSNLFIVNLAYVLKTEPLKFFQIAENELLLANSYSLMALHGGTLVGVLIFGFLADRKGRMLMLFVSIFLYSISTILTGMVSNFNSFLFLKFTAGLGTASEFGIGLVIVAEIYGSKNRSYLVALIAIFGYLAMLLVAFLATFMDWQDLYVLGGFIGLFVMVFRFSTFESDIFKKSLKTSKKEISFFELFKMKELLYCVLGMLPVYFISASSTFIGATYHKNIELSNENSVQAFAIGGICAIILNAFFSLKLRSRKKVILANIIFLMLTYYLYFFVKITPSVHLIFSFSIGLFATFQFEMLLLTIETFETRLRAMATTLVFGISRASIFLFSFLIPKTDRYVNDYKITCFMFLIVICFLAFWSLYKLKEHYNRDLNF